MINMSYILLSAVLDMKKHTNHRYSMIIGEQQTLERVK